MFALIKFVFGCSVVAALLLVGASCLPSSVRSELGLQEASTQADFMVLQIAAQFPSSLHSFSESTGDFVRSNTSSVRSQFESMKNSLPPSLALTNFIPGRTSTWIQSGVEAASRVAGSKPRVMAKNVPLVNAAVNVTGAHIASLKQSFSGAAPAF